ncbi:MAG: tRNA 2-thiouridine(34) synthase MnmA [Chlamydiota bacterium]
MNKKPVVVIGMSGGVDSSVSALLLKEQGYEVIGMFMKNWEEKNATGVCAAAKEYEDVVRVCEQIDIPYYSVNFAEEYQTHVFSHFLEELKAGFTPNPDILCNREIKFKYFFEKALSLGAGYLATGHYCQTDNGLLYKGLDNNKDQSYFLYTLQKKTLHQVLFPIGHLEKSEVRALAHKHNLATAAKKDSTGICFIGKRDFKEFVSHYLAFQPGNFETLSGKVVGQHDGIAYYTIGQRKGLAIGGPGDAWFVVGKDVSRNVVFLEQGTDHPSLYAPALTATEASWVSGALPEKFPFHCTAKIRYRQEDQECVIKKIDDGRLFVSFLKPQRAITPRQSIVFYDKTRCLGGAMIEAASLLHD